MRVSWRSIQPAADFERACGSLKRPQTRERRQRVRSGAEGRVAAHVSVASSAVKKRVSPRFSRSSLACFALQPWLVSHPEHVSKPSHQRANENWVRRARRGQKAPIAPACICCSSARRRRRAHTRAPEMLRLSNAPSLHIAAARRRRPHHTHAHAQTHDAKPLKTHAIAAPRPATRPHAHRRRELGPPLPHPGSFLGIGLGVVFGAVWSTMQTGPVARAIASSTTRTTRRSGCGTCGSSSLVARAKSERRSMVGAGDGV